MKFNITDPLAAPEPHQVRVGDVYKPMGGRAGRDNWLHVIVSIIPGGGHITGTLVVYLSIDTQGVIRSGSQSGIHVYERRVPVGYVEGLEELSFDMVPL